MTRCFVGLGSNEQNPAAQISRALTELAAIPRTRLTRCSRLYGSTAIGPGKQDDYINAVAELDTELSALSLLDALQAVEAAHDRQRHIHWGPRTLDLDLLLFGDSCVAESRLTLPHPNMWERPFVLFPLGELAPEVLITRGLGLYTDAANCDPAALWLLDTTHAISDAS